jgi:hypothetical protein
MTGDPNGSTTTKDFFTALRNSGNILAQTQNLKII